MDRTNTRACACLSSSRCHAAWRQPSVCLWHLASTYVSAPPPSQRTCTHRADRETAADGAVVRGPCPHPVATWETACAAQPAFPVRVGATLASKAPDDGMEKWVALPVPTKQAQNNRRCVSVPAQVTRVRVRQLSVYLASTYVASQRTHCHAPRRSTDGGRRCRCALPVLLPLPALGRCAGDRVCRATCVPSARALEPAHAGRQGHRCRMEKCARRI